MGVRAASCRLSAAEWGDRAPREAFCACVEIVFAGKRLCDRLRHTAGLIVSWAMDRAANDARPLANRAPTAVRRG